MKKVTLNLLTKPAESDKHTLALLIGTSATVIELADKLKIDIGAVTLTVKIHGNEVSTGFIK